MNTEQLRNNNWRDNPKY